MPCACAPNRINTAGDSWIGRSTPTVAASVRAPWPLASTTLSAGSVCPSITTPVIRWPAASMASTVPWRMRVPAACAPASNWCASAAGSNAKSSGAQAASGGSSAIIGSISATWVRASRSIRVPAVRCSAIMAAVSSSVDRQSSAPRAAIGNGPSSRSRRVNSSSAFNRSANAVGLSEGVLALAPTHPKDEAVAVERSLGARSINVTAAPALDRCQAADAPMMPPPTTTTLPLRFTRGMCLMPEPTQALHAARPLQAGHRAWPAPWQSSPHRPARPHHFAQNASRCGS